MRGTPPGVPPGERRGGSILVFVGMVLLALNLRVVVTSISPIVAYMDRDIPFDDIALGAIGMLAPVGFAVGGLAANAIARRAGLESATLGAAVLLAAALTTRALSGGITELFISTALALIGAGIGNVLIPTIIKQHFPLRAGAITSLYLGLLAVSAAAPAAAAAPLAEPFGWRASLGLWALLAACAVIPWVIILLKWNSRTKIETRRTPTARVSILSSRVAWALLITHGTSSLQSYTMFAWLPQLLIQYAGTSAVEAGALLAIYALIGLPIGPLVSHIIIRSPRQDYVVLGLVGMLLLGYFGILLFPTGPTLLWVLALATGPTLFACVQALFGLRTRDPAVTAAVSGFTQGFGYLVAATGPVVFGLLLAVSGNWVVPILFLILTSFGGVVSASILRRPTIIDDEIGHPNVSST